MKSIVKKSIIVVTLIAIFAYILTPETVNDYQTTLDIQVKQININKSK